MKLVRFTEPILVLPADPGSPIGSPTTARSHLFLPPWFSMQVEHLEIGGGRVLLTHGQETSRRGQYVLEGLDATIAGASLRGVESFAIKGFAREGPVTGSFRATGRLAARSRFNRTLRGEMNLQVDRCPLEPFRAIALNFKETLPFSNGILQLKCNLKGDSRNFHMSGQGGISQVTLLPGEYFVNGVSLDEARFNFAADREGNTVRINVAELQLPGMTVSAESTLRDLNGNGASLELAVRKGDFDLAKFLPLVPLNLMNSEDRARFEDAGLNGRVVITGGNWYGKVSDIMIDPWRRGTLAVDAYLDKGFGVYPARRPADQGCHGKNTSRR